MPPRPDADGRGTRATDCGRRRRPHGDAAARVVTAFAAVLAGAACVPGPRPVARPSEQPVLISSADAWASQVCDAVGSWLATLRTPGQRAAPLPPPAQYRRLRDRAATATDATGRLIDDLAAVGPPPGDPGSPVLGELSTAVAHVRDDLVRLDATLAISAWDPDAGDVGRAGVQVSAALQHSADRVGAAIEQVRVRGPSPDLRTAFRSAARCRELDRPPAPLG